MRLLKRAAVAALAVLALACIGQAAVPAATPAPTPAACVSPDDTVEAWTQRLAPLAAKVVIIAGTPAQGISDALTAITHGDHYDVAAVMVFVATNGIAAVIGIDAAGCKVAGGVMTLDAFNAVGASVGVPAIAAPPPKPPDNSI